MSHHLNSEKFSILLIEDDPNDQILIRRAVKKANILNSVFVLGDGEKAIQYLSGEKDYSDRSKHPLPILIILDLKMPKVSGLDVIEYVKKQPLIKRIPIIVLTSSKDTSDINSAYDLGVNSYLVKPVKFEDLVNIMVNMASFWISSNIHPQLE